MAWCRTAMMMQSVMQELIGLVIFVYVDDCFWILPSFTTESGKDSEKWVLGVFKKVMTDLMGWSLDPDKEATGDSMVLLGLHVEMRRDVSVWTLDERKAEMWTKEIVDILRRNELHPAMASKICGKLCFLNTHIFNRMGRALLRPIIWRQIQRYGTTKLTPRLRWALGWFLAAISQRLSRQIPLVQTAPRKQVILYSDADGKGRIGVVASCSDGTVLSGRAKVPASLRRLLRPRLTNIIAFELVAAVVAIIGF